MNLVSLLHSNIIYNIHTNTLHLVILITTRQYNGVSTFILPSMDASNMWPVYTGLTDLQHMTWIQ